MTEMERMERREEFVASIRRKVRDFSKATEVEVTPQATVLIETLLVGFLEDPHPGWKIDPFDHARHADKLVEGIPSFLRGISEGYAPNRAITTYDVQGWLSHNLSSICVYVCPFQGGAG